MKLLVLGATGGIGRQVVARALARGDDVTALVRTPAKLTTKDARLQIIAGNPLDRSTLDRVVQNHDAVISILGHLDLKPSMLVTEGAKALTEAMVARDVRRLVIVSSTLVAPGGNILTKIPRAVTKHALADSAAMENVVRKTALAWTILRLVRLTNDASSDYEIFDERPPSVFESLSRNAAAACLLDLARDDVASRRVVAARAADRDSAFQLVAGLEDPTDDHHTDR